jgi:hypothetical protein
MRPANEAQYIIFQASTAIYFFFTLSRTLSLYAYRGNISILRFSGSSGTLSKISISLLLQSNLWSEIPVSEDEVSVSRYTMLSGTTNVPVIEFLRFLLSVSWERLILLTLIEGRCLV